MLGVKRNARNANEIITGVTVPILDGWQGYAKVGVRNAMVISVASACLAVDRKSKSVRIALGAVGPTIIRCRDAESWLVQQLDLTTATSIDTTIAREFGRRVALESKPIDDHRSTAEYRRHAVGVLAQRLITRAYSS
jgi:CO/xanthine dehydrogenase FAD-binding subunit